MNRAKIICAIVALLAAALACITNPGTPTRHPPTTGPTSLPPIGVINKIQGGVESGPESALQPVSSSRDMYQNDAAHVFNNGKARLDFGHGIVFTLYNDTLTGGTKVSASGQVAAKLSQGGLLGYNPEGSRTEIHLPNNGSILVYGTEYCVLFDPARGISIACNFNGRVEYSISGSSFTPLPPNAMVEFDRNRVLHLYRGLDLSPEIFDKYASESRSAIEGLQRLKEEYRLPAIPRLAAPENGSMLDYAPTLEWYQVEEAASYHVQVSSDPGFFSPEYESRLESTRWEVPARLPVGIYYWRVQAMSIFEIPGEWSEVSTFSISTPPETPILLDPPDGQVVATTAPKFSWTAVNDAARYEIQISYYPDYSYSEFDDSTTATGWGPPPYGLSMNEYYWHVRAFNSLDTPGEWSKTFKFTVNLPPEAPILLGPAANAMLITGDPQLWWQPVSGASRYDIQLSFTPYFDSLVIEDVSKSTDWTPPYTLSNDTYFWRVRASNAYDTAGPWSEDRAFIIDMLPGPPAPYFPEDDSYVSTMPTFYWFSATNAASYEIQLAQNTSFTYPAYYTSVRNNEWTVPAPLNGSSTYYWRVRGLNSHGMPGEWSKTWQINVYY